MCDCRFVATQGHLVVEVAGELVLLQRETGVYFGLNPTAKLVWDSIQTPASLADLVTNICRGFKINQAIAKQDAERLLRELVDAGLAEAQTPAP